jgi:phosphate transport system protein
MDKDLALEIMAIEKRVNAFELKIDRDCENIFALFNPVAVDLRFVLAVLKINTNLERTGDIAEGIAKFVRNMDANFDRGLLQETRVLEMFNAARNMMDHVLEAFEKEDTNLARKIFVEDEILNEINLTANSLVANYIRTHNENIEQALYLLSIIRKLERVGDQAKNMAEEIVFYVEAKVLRHLSKLDESKD